MFARFAALFVLCLPITSHAGLRFSFAGAGDLTNFAAKDIGDPSDLTFEKQLGYGGGLLVAVPFGLRVEVETGAIYLIRNWQYSGNYSLGGVQVEKLQGSAIEVPLLFRYWFGKGGIALGGVASSGMGKVKSTVTQEGETGVQTEVSYSDLSLDNLNLGVAAGFGYRAAIGTSGTTGFLLDLRYQYGVRNRFLYAPDSATGEITTSEVRLLMGFTFGGAKR
jgi:hypothetical protein